MTIGQFPLNLGLENAKHLFLLDYFYIIHLHWGYNYSISHIYESLLPDYFWVGAKPWLKRLSLHTRG
jgi:hypothetical protein